MNEKKEPTREDARQILRKGILDMSIERLIQMSQFGLMGNIILSNNAVFIQNVFNRIDYDEEKDIITFSVEEGESALYGSVSFKLDSIAAISGCEDADNPEDYLNINIEMEDDTAIKIKVLY